MKISLSYILILRKLETRPNPSLCYTIRLRNLICQSFTRRAKSSFSFIAKLGKDCTCIIIKSGVDVTDSISSGSFRMRPKVLRLCQCLIDRTCRRNRVTTRPKINMRHILRFQIRISTRNAKFNFLSGGNNWWANIDPRAPRIKLSRPTRGHYGKSLYRNWYTFRLVGKEKFITGKLNGSSTEVIEKNWLVFKFLSSAIIN